MQLQQLTAASLREADTVVVTRDDGQAFEVHRHRGGVIKYGVHSSVLAKTALCRTLDEVKTTIETGAGPVRSWHTTN